MTQEEAAVAMGLSLGGYRKLEYGERQLKADQIKKAAEVFGVSEGAILSAPAFVPILGRAGAGPQGSVLFAAADSNFGMIPAPVNSTRDTVAVEVQGDSMRGMADDGWLITYDDKKPPSEEHMREPCVCWLEGGKVLVKYLYPGRSPGLYDLISINAQPMTDQPVRYAALITNIIPRRAAKKFIRRHPDHPVSDVKVG